MRRAIDRRPPAPRPIPPAPGFARRSPCATKLPRKLSLVLLSSLAEGSPSPSMDRRQGPRTSIRNHCYTGTDPPDGQVGHILGCHIQGTWGSCCMQRIGKICVIVPTNRFLELRIASLHDSAHEARPPGGLLPPSRLRSHLRNTGLKS